MVIAQPLLTNSNDVLQACQYRKLKTDTNNIHLLELLT